ncbi:uncharacterized protein [Rutidosis leptorrhynchoides]|uniref:uncharacterized protein isoform X2 n=1 Tax=Rutidosis leptorrhynchoides TaxID=125765 RepID=UPI003A9923CA
MRLSSKFSAGQKCSLNCRWVCLPPLGSTCSQLPTTHVAMSPSSPSNTNGATQINTLRTTLPLYYRKISFDMSVLDFNLPLQEKKFYFSFNGDFSVLKPLDFWLSRRLLIQ